MKRLPSTVKRYLMPLISILLFVAAWEGLVRIMSIPRYVLPSPTAVGTAMKNDWSLLLHHTSFTLLETALGLLLAVILASAVAILLSQSRWVYEAVYPLLIISQTIPLMVLAILLPLWFGWGLLPKVLIVTLVCFFPVAISFLKGLLSVDNDLVNLFRSMGASQLTIVKLVKIPAALPSFFAGLRIAATYSIMAAVISEWVGAQRGLGVYMTIKQKGFAVDQVLAAVVIICGLSYVLVKLVDLIEYTLTPWNRPRHSNENDTL